MSGYNGKVHSLLYPQVRAERYLVDPVAFVLAMFGGPVLVTVLSFWLVGIPVAALILGGPLFLIIGTPVLLWHLVRHTPEVSMISLLALISVGTLFVVTAILAALFADYELVSVAVWYGLFGGIFAPLWGAMTGWIYIRLRREVYFHPVHV